MNQRREYMNDRDGDEYVRITECRVGSDSESGKAFNCKIDGEWVWVPYSQCKARHINQKVHGEDVIEVSKWLADKNEWNHK